jgi:signal transduction histidine kinase
MACIGYLSAGIAHEINNPLGFVSSNFNTLKKYIDKVTEYISEYIKLKNTIEQGGTDAISEGIANINALEANNKIDFIISDLADLYIDTDEGISRIKNIVLTLKNFVHDSNNSSFDNYNINKGIEDTLVIVKNEIKYNIEIKTDFLKDIKIIKANSGEINQVLLNIIINASHSIKEKYKLNADFNGMIKINTKSDEEFVYCSIEDNGIGISEENMSKIFNPFFTTKPIGVGTGLGLSISYDIVVNKHKGDIKIKSEVGKGAEFVIILPLNTGKKD